MWASYWKVWKSLLWKITTGKTASEGNSYEWRSRKTKRCLTTCCWSRFPAPKCPQLSFKCIFSLAKSYLFISLIQSWWPLCEAAVGHLTMASEAPLGQLTLTLVSRQMPLQGIYGQWPCWRGFEHSPLKKGANQHFNIPDCSTGWNWPDMQISSCFWRTMRWMAGGRPRGLREKIME